MSEPPNMPDLPGDDATIELWTAAAAGGDVEALEALFAVSHDRLLGLARRKVGVDWQGKIDPDDILQEAYIAAFNGIDRFEPEGADAFYRWVAAIIDHRFIDAVRALRRQKRDVTRQQRMPSRISRHESLVKQLGDISGRPSQVARRQDAIGALMACLAQLPEDQRAAVQRLHLDEAPLAEVARELDRTEDATRRLAGRGLEKLERLMGRRSRYLSGDGGG
ncbi:MAG: sigma-70 family RNA polymerase sigma factor [Phycisphaeraceae bacterium]|nr:sigma-70 family RNA polymerase sigma factor [Phycisphaeraceae bacterium]